VSHAPEKHFTASASVRDIIIGMSDGLTVPFALAAGLTGAIAASSLVVTAGLAEMVAGAISMGLGGYLAARSDAEHYLRERGVEEREVNTVPNREEQEIVDIFAKYGVGEEQSRPIVEVFRTNHKAWIDFMMSNELGLSEPSPRRARISALTIGGSYIVGGIVPLAPYFFVHNARQALIPSVIVTAIALFIFGYFKAYASGTNAFRSAVETIVVGGIAATAAFMLARLISG
jgi:vacuolar iron transporter family protein